MTLFRGLALTPKSEIAVPTERYLRFCLEDAIKVVAAYQALTESDSLIMHWTCVNDILLTGFMILYSSLRITVHESSAAEDIMPSQIKEAIETCRRILFYISTTWKIIKYHLGLLERLLSAVTIFSQDEGNPTQSDNPTEQDQQMQDIPLAMISSELAEGTEPHPVLAPHSPPGPWDSSFTTSLGDEFRLSDDELRQIL